MRSKIVSLATAVTVLLGAAAAHAQQDNTATVEALFSEGKKLMAAGKTAEACPKFLASYNIEHRVGTLLNLAACYEKNGEVASAWARFVEARTLASRNNQPERADFAAQHAAALEPRRSMLTITVANPPAGLVVKRDGVVVNAAIFGTAVPVDGGMHSIEATATGKKSLLATVTVANEADRKTYALPPLVDGPKTVATASPDTSPASSPHPSHMATSGVIGLGLAGAGVIAAGIGVVFGVQALSKNSESNANGDCTGNTCNPTGFAARTTARSDGDLSSVLIGAGGAAIVGGVVLWLAAPKGGTSTGSAGHVVVGVGPAGLDLRGAF